MAAVTLALAACGGQAVSGAQGSLAGGTQFAGATLWPPADRSPAPHLSGTTLNRRQLSLAAFGGTVVVMNFWGSWCAPCRAEASALAALSRECQPLGVRFVGADERDDRLSAMAFERGFGIGYPSLYDPAGQVPLAFQGSVPVSAIPSTIVIDRQGRIAARVIGATTYTSLKALLARVTVGGC
jgi:thiol-disulfide isomerase/thioredoxin